ncbi:MAG TPA: UbiA family prenyltransferase [Chloroflexota bacterium]|nr:UbiA family prenyltransferase [Chloroflexota bacterium]
MPLSSSAEPERLANPELAAGDELISAVASLKAKSLVGLLHPVPVALTLVATVAFALVSRNRATSDSQFLSVVVIIALSQIAIALFNDVCDLELDRRNRPERALPRRLIGVGRTIAMVVVCAALSIGLAFEFGILSGVLVALGTTAGLMYSAWFKGTSMSWVPFAIAFPLLPIWELLVFHNHTGKLWSIAVIGIPAATAIHLSDALPDRETDLSAGSGGAATRLPRRWVTALCRSLLILSGAFCASLAWMTAVPPLGYGAPFVGVLAAAFWPGTSGSWRRYLIPIGALVIGAMWISALAF